MAIDKTPLPKSLSTLAIGSVPFLDPAEAIEQSAVTLDIPASPQLVRLSAWEDMLFSAVSGLPALVVDEQARTVTAVSEGREEALAHFYEQYFTGDVEFLALGEKSRLGFDSLLQRAKIDENFGRSYLKAQVVGPLTFGQSVKVQGAYSLADDAALLEAAALGLGGKAAWAAERIRELNRIPVVFLDEPGLSGYGSAFSTLTPQTVVSALSSAVDAARAKGPVLVGCHVCGNTDWGLLTQVGLDIINFDAYAYLEAVCLYPKQFKTFLDGGGALCWGIVPTTDFDESRHTSERLSKMIKDGWSNLASKGIDKELLRERTLIASACGLGGLSIETAKSILAMLPKVAQALVD
ncbi:MAG: hypothetical protein LBT62_02380 [Deltaproteobacteria bacterium]|jgi:hypothetical protein|nr:hypothetical protein [Deltaproteobacteria bacterium]